MAERTGTPTSRPGGKRPGGSTSTAAERRAKAVALREAQLRSARRRRLLIGGVGVVVVAAAVVAITLVATSGSDPAPDTSTTQALPAAVTTADGATTPQLTAQRVSNPSGIDGVLAWDTAGYPATTGDPDQALQHDHVTGPVTYTVTPPVGGPHNPIWLNAGVYTEPVPTERAVHDLEHGAVWITYRSDLPADQVATLTAFAGSQTMIAEQSESAVSGQQNRYMVVSPWAGSDLPAPIVLSAWGYQLQVQSPTDDRMQRFVDTFRHSQTYTPEFGAAVDGIPTGTGGVPASFGSLKPNPAGTVPTS